MITNMNDFLKRIFLLFPPGRDENTAELFETYKLTMATETPYDYERALKEFVKSYKYRKTPSCADLMDTLSGFIIKNNEPIELCSIIAWNNERRYEFAYNPKNDNYSAVKRDLIARGFRVFDSEQKECVNG